MNTTGEVAAGAATLDVERSMLDVARAGAPGWQGPGFRRRRLRAPPGQRWRWRLWALLLPRQGWQIRLTLPGALLVAMALAIGAAAYNTSNNILFIVLSLLLSCLLLSGVLSWLNFRGLRWRLRAPPPWRVGVEHTAVVELRNDRQVQPAYALWFELNATGLAEPERIGMDGRLDPGGQMELEWCLRPTRRGRMRVELAAAGTSFPFGFLQKIVGGGLDCEGLVWPAAVPYQAFAASAGWQQRPGARRAQSGPRGGDLQALRRYAAGDSQRVIHWKASARLRRLMVREFAPELEEGVTLWLQTSAETWTRAEQFELLCSFAATLAEDLFRAGQLRAVAINDGPVVPLLRLGDLEAFLDRLALLEQVKGPPGAPGPGRAGMLTFAPDGGRGVVAYVDGIKAAAA